MLIGILTLLPLITALSAIAEGDCPGRDLTAFRMSSVFYNGERVRPFLLNTAGGEYEPCSGQEVRMSRNPEAIVAGVRTADGQVHEVDYMTLLIESKDYRNNEGIITPLPRMSEDQCFEGDHYLSDEVSTILDLMNEAQGHDQIRLQTLELVYEFNRTAENCDRIAESEHRLPALLNTWRDFCRDRDPEICQRAKEVDMLARTIAFEANPPGELDGIEVDRDTDMSALSMPQSRCERRFIAMTLRNRGR
ncbi:MAG: hypothetical protein AAF202_13050, partial [Pseudomonadota bacterium]